MARQSGIARVVTAARPLVRPRFGWAPPCDRSLGAECAAFWRAAGGELFAWQELVLEGMLGLDQDERWVASTSGLDVARQNGKGVVLQAIEVFFAFELGYDVVMHTAHEFATAQVHQIRLEQVIQDAPHLHAKVKAKGGYMHANGRESINLKSGAQIIFKARTKGGGRGYSGDLLVWDEAMVLPDAVVGAQRPMLRASRSPHGLKLVYAGSAVDQEVHEHGANFALLRARGIAKDPRVSWHEWSAPYELSEMTEERLRDRSWWPLANPSMADGLISEETMADDIDSMPPRTAAVELGGVGDWPEPGGKAGTVLDAKVWDALADSRSRIVDPLAFGVSVSADRAWSNVAAAGRRPDGRYGVEVIARLKGTGRVAGWVAERVEKHEPVAVVCNGVGAAATLEHRFEEAGVELVMLGATEYAAACGLLFDLVEERSIRHRGAQEDLAAALSVAAKSARRRPLGDRWAWSGKAAGADISPLEAATLALWGFETVEQQAAPMVAFG